MSNPFTRYWHSGFRHSWRGVVLAAIFSLLLVCGVAAVGKASAAPLHDPLRPAQFVTTSAVQSVQPHSCVLENPDRPCWATPPQLVDKYNAGDLGQSGHTGWSDHTKYLMKTAYVVWRNHHQSEAENQLLIEGFNPNDCTADCWYQHFIATANCVTPAGKPYICIDPGGEATDMNILCAGDAVGGFILGRFWGAGVGAVLCYWHGLIGLGGK